MTITLRRATRDDLETLVRFNQGLAAETESKRLDPDTITRGVTDISYPVFGFGGELMAALTIPFLETIDGSQSVTLAEARKLLAVKDFRVWVSAIADDHERFKAVKDEEDAKN